MAATEYRIADNPYYYDRYPKDVADQISLPSQSSGRTVDGVAQAQDTDVLVSILMTLQKLDIKMVAQSKRLQRLETRSMSSMSPDSTVYSPLSRHRSVRSTLSKYDFNDYEKSILELKQNMEDESSLAESVQDTTGSCSTSIFEHPQTSTLSTVESSQDVTSCLPDHSRALAPLNSRPIDLDAYSESEYTDMLSSRMSVNHLADAPSQLHPPSCVQAPAENDVDMRVERVSSGIAPVVEEAKLGSTAEGGQHDPGYVRIHVRASLTSPEHQRTEMNFQAFENWKRGVVSKLRGDLQRAWKKEKERLGALKLTEKRQTWLERLLGGARKALQANRGKVLQVGGDAGLGLVS
jgi:hypothetical protein